MTAERPPTPAQVEQALATLSDTEREVFLAHRLDGLGYDVIAAATGLGVDEVELHIANAMLKIDRALDRICAP